MNLELKTEFDLPDSKYAYEFLESYSNSKNRKLVFGNNIYSNSVISHFKVDAIIDDFNQNSLGLPSITSGDIKPEDLVIVCSGGNILSALQKVKSSGAKYIDYFHLQKFSEFPLRGIYFNEGFEEAFKKNLKNFKKVYSLLEDERSREIFIQLIGFRLTGNTKYLMGFSDLQEKQYFEEFLFLKNLNEVFYDVGAFDGANTQKFRELCPGFLQINMFEPDPVNYLELQKNLTFNEKIKKHNFGLSDLDENAMIISSGSTSSVNSTSGDPIKLFKLDNIVSELQKPTLIKMDIEGGELKAISGAEKTIRECKPQLAISVYHKINDFWEIPLKILEIEPNYKLRFRHYTESIYETVAFFTRE